jgi:hypothetical protein
MEPKPSPGTQSYILRAWHEDTPERTWRFRMQFVGTGEVYGFNDLDSLQHFLKERFDQESDIDEQQANVAAK